MREPGHALFEWAPVLIEAFSPYPNVTIVLSTSWVRVLGFDRTRASLPPILRERVVGATFHRREHAPTRTLRDLWSQSLRGIQIARDIERRQPAKWFAIDDAADEFLPWQAAWLVSCESETGLSAPATQMRLLEVLAKVHAN